MKLRLKALRDALRTPKILTQEAPDAPALLCAAHWADHTTALRLLVPPHLLVMEGGFAYDKDSHHFLRALAAGADALRGFYARFQPAGLAAMYALPGGRTGADLPPWETPWIATARSRAPRGEGGLGPEHGAAVYGPATEAKVQLEMQRLTATADSIRRHGYQPGKHGDITGFLLRRGDGVRFLIRGGKHRAAALVHLGQPLVPVQFKPHWPRVIDRADAAHWPLVRAGKLDAALAAEIFDRHFGLTLAERWGT